ncbi:pyridoxamine 5'-phosphate oxidase [Pontibacter locisalis]|uniref:Pyridoxine/pyridoxamine 5'-phosphate oxidase n=1 Tax=Pontibacter locisalis TaxID=1719035 RepID=A0ABW5IQS5_9BACT
MTLTHNIADIRKNYSRQALTEDSVLQDPIQQFQVWLQEAITAEAEEPTAFVLSTASKEGQPSARVVLLKDVANGGFTFFTNYDSRKGRELAQNPLASITFFWASLERQVRIDGSVEKIPPQLSEAYFHSRPKGSQIGAWASPQSQEIESRKVLEESDSYYISKFADAELVPRPEHWGGYKLIPAKIEFWQGRPNRLHDRIVYERADDAWKLKRLAP